jgi:hypothetical protein
MHDVIDSDMREDAADLPYAPVTLNMELPVEAIMLAKASITTGETRTLTME